MRRSSITFGSATLIRLLCLAATVASMASAVGAEPSAATVAEFTKRVQPLLLNRCATGACHGGSAAGDLRFTRGDVAGRIDRGITLGNMQAILQACGHDRDPAALLATISARHPASVTLPHHLSQPLTPRERATLEHWLKSALAAHTFASPTTPTRPPSRNRLQELLDTAANPPPLPPPQEPQGILLK